jgi:hypothetical protein
MGNGDIAPPFLTSELNEDERPASRPGRFTPGRNRSRYRLDMRPFGPPYRCTRRHIPEVSNLVVIAVREPQTSHRLRVYLNKMPSKIFGPTKQEVTGEWKRRSKKKRLLITKYYFGDNVNFYQMGWTCSIHRSDVRGLFLFSRGTMPHGVSRIDSDLRKR